MSPAQFVTVSDDGRAPQGKGRGIPSPTPKTKPLVDATRVLLATDSADPSGLGHHLIALARHLPDLRLLQICGSAIRDAIITHVVPLGDGPDFLTSLVETRLQIVLSHRP
jgi:hypothetical protein